MNRHLSEQKLVLALATGGNSGDRRGVEGSPDVRKLPGGGITESEVWAIDAQSDETENPSRIMQEGLVAAYNI